MNWVQPVALLLTTVLVVFAQSSFTGFRTVLAAQPDLIPAVVVYAALHAGLGTTTATAIVGGLGLDALSSGPFGLSVIPLVLLGVWLHRRRELLLRESPWAQAALGGAAALAVAVVSIVLLLGLWPLISPERFPAPELVEIRPPLAEPPVVGPGVIWQMLVVTVAGAVGSLVLFRWFSWIETTFHYRPAPEVRHRMDREIERGRF